MPPQPTPSRSGLARRLLRSAIARPALGMIGCGALLANVGGHCSRAPEHREPSPSVAAAIALNANGLNSRPPDIHWIDPPSKRHMPGLGIHRFVAIAREKGEPEDIWLGEARLSPEGRWLALSALHNLSDTSAVAETGLTVDGERVGWLVTDGTDATAVQVVDFKGRKLPANGDWTLLDRWQTRLTFLQETGQLAGLCRRNYRFASARRDVVLAWIDSGLEVRNGTERGVLRCDDAAIGNLSVSAEPSELGSPGDLVTWAVDRVRALPFVGAERMQWVKAIAFQALDRLDAAKSKISSDANPRLEVAASADFLGMQPTAGLPDPESGWPPAPMSPILSAAAEGEGVFRSLDSDPFALPPDGQSSPFAVAFVRPDATRQDAQIHIVVWDPRRLELHTMTGTREPKTATGETGSGTVPREEAVVGRLAGAFNGGFQATHGEFGMMAQRIVYLPPKPYAATVVEQADGTVGFGTWPDAGAIPAGFVGFRQNLTPLVADGANNPYGRTWWGGVPSGWQDATRTVRTGLCLTKEHFVAYFYGGSTSADHLTKAMQSARCDYGVHLDMNPGHTGFEFYRVGKSGTLPDLPRKLDGAWEAKGAVTGMVGWDFLGRRMLRGMHLMHFPRYIRTDSRDFFYLTHRHILPPPNPSPTLGEPASSQRDAWETRAYTQGGYPPAIATKRIAPDPARPRLTVSVAVMDAKWLTQCAADCADASTILHMKRAHHRGTLGLFQHERRLLLTNADPPSDATPVLRGFDEEHLPAKVVAAAGIAHSDWLYYAEITEGGERSTNVAVLKRLLKELGCDESLFLDQSLELSFGKEPDNLPRAARISWRRNDGPMATRVFRETAVVPRAVWQPLQDRRVRYLRQKATATTPAAASTGVGNSDAASIGLGPSPSDASE